MVEDKVISQQKRTGLAILMIDDDFTFNLEYLYTQFELFDEEQVGIAYWLALMDMHQKAERFHMCQRGCKSQAQYFP
jgi:hypothetical protein